MNNKKSKGLNWPLYFGGFFFLLVFVFGMQWLTTEVNFEDWVKVGLGMVASLLVGAIGIWLQQTWRNMFTHLFGQVLVALGFGGMITSLLFGGFAYDFYPREVTAGLTGIISLGWIAYSHVANKRILLNLSLTGLFAVPFAWGTEHVWPVFIYLILTHMALSWTAYRNKWLELTILTNVFAWSMLTIYAIGVGYQDAWLVEPLFILIASMLYLRISSWVGVQRSDGNDDLFIHFRPYMDIGFSLLSMLIFFGWFNGLTPDYGIAIYIAVIGLSHSITAQLLPHLDRPAIRFYQNFLTISAIGHMILASLVLNATLDWELKSHIIMMVWSVLAYGLSWLQSKVYRYVGWAIWLLAVYYGLVTTWSAPIGEWFGVYLPFLNTGAFSWIVAALVGYRFISTSDKYKEDRTFTIINTIVICLIIGGLLYIQTTHAFTEYGWSPELYQLSLSGVLGVYALCWFLWSVSIKQRWMELVSVILLGIVGLKALFVDLWGTSPLYKMLLFALLGVMSLFMVWIDRKAYAKEDDSLEV